jgi:hypothetical protein
VKRRQLRRECAQREAQPCADAVVDAAAHRRSFIFTLVTISMTLTVFADYCRHFRRFADAASLR